LQAITIKYNKHTTGGAGSDDVRSYSRWGKKRFMKLKSERERVFQVEKE
jgi:hypothetical protein